MQRTVIARPQPAAGAGDTFTLQESVSGRLVAVTFRLVTSAAVANRTPIVKVNGGDGVPILSVAAGKTQAASLTGEWSFGNNLGQWSNASTAVLCGPVPFFDLEAGDQIAISVDAIDAADQLSRIRLVLLQDPVRP